MKYWRRTISKLYRRYIYDFWGEIILKGKHNRIFFIIIKQFYSDLKKILYKKKHLRLHSNSKTYMKKLPEKILTKYFITSKNLYNNYISIPLLLKIYQEFWRNFVFCDKYFLNIKVNDYVLLNRRFIAKKRRSGRSFKYSTWMDHPLIFKNSTYRWPRAFSHLLVYYKKNLRKIRKTRRIRPKPVGGKYGEKLTPKQKKREEQLKIRYPYKDYKSWLSLPWKRHIPRKSAWWRSRVQQRKVSLFYGIQSRKKFRFLQGLYFKSMNIQLFTCFRLELMLCTIVFRMNIFSNMYFTKNFIRIGGCLVNGIIVTYPYRALKLNDIISINLKFFKKIFNKVLKLYFMTSRRKLGSLSKKYYLSTPKIFLLPPNYLEVNYKILHCKIWRMPKRSDIINLQPLSNSLDYFWSISSKVGYY